VRGPTAPAARPDPAPPLPSQARPPLSPSALPAVPPYLALPNAVAGARTAGAAQSLLDAAAAPRSAPGDGSTSTLADLDAAALEGGAEAEPRDRTSLAAAAGGVGGGVAGGGGGGVAGEAAAGGGVAVVVDAEATSYLMMGALSPGVTAGGRVGRRVRRVGLRVVRHVGWQCGCAVGRGCSWRAVTPGRGAARVRGIAL
jgi:hypothetical protein